MFKANLRMIATQASGQWQRSWRMFGVRLGRPAALLFGLLIVLLVALGPGDRLFGAAGDVDLYETYGRGVLASPLQWPTEYPPLAALIFALPALLTPNAYLGGFVAFAVLAAWLTLLVVDRLSGQGWWLLLYVALGAWGTIFFRYDIFVVLLTVLAFWAATRQRWATAQALLALGVAFKLYPVILMPLVVLWQWRAERRLPWRSLLSGAVCFTLAIGSVWLIAPQQTIGMLAYHRDRPLEMESIGASLVWLSGPVRYEFSYGSLNLIGAASPFVISAATLLTVALLLLTYGGFWRGWIGPAAAWALTLLASITTSKVFSTQYVLWVMPSLALAHAAAPRRRAGSWVADLPWLWAVIFLCTSIMYPLILPRLPADRTMGVVTLRNALWLVACGLAVPL